MERISSLPLEEQPVGDFEVRSACRGVEGRREEG
jgi:hypothetical protein